MSGGVAVSVTKYKGRYWAVYDAGGALICVCVYRKGAEEVRRRLTDREGSERG